MPYILPPNISLISNSPIRIYPVDTSRPRHLREDITQTIPNTHPHHFSHPHHTPPITPTTYDDLRGIFNTLRIADAVHIDHHQSINRLAPSYRQLDCLSSTHYPPIPRCSPHNNHTIPAMPADRRSTHPRRTPYSSTSNRNVGRAPTNILSDANGPSPIIVRSTPAERELLSRGSTVVRPDRGAAIWPRITGQGPDFNTYRVLRSRYQEGHEHDDLFFLMDLAWNAVCEHAILESQNTGPTTAAAIAEGKSYAYHLKGLISHLYDQSWALYLVHGPRDSGENLEWAGRDALKRLVDRAFAVLAAVTALGRPYQECRVAWQDLVDRLGIELRRPIRAVRIRPDSQAVGGDVEMAPTSPIVATINPGPGFRDALERRIRSIRDPSRTARRLPNIPSSLVDPNSPRRELDTGLIPSSSPIQVIRVDPQSPGSPIPTGSMQVPARSLSQEESASSTGRGRAHSPPSSPRLDQLPPHQGASPIAPDGSDWPMDNGDDDAESTLEESAPVRLIVESPGEANRRALSDEYENRVRLYGVERYHYLLAHPHHPDWDEIIPRTTPPVLRMHPREARRYWAMPVDENEVEEAIWWEI